MKALIKLSVIALALVYSQFTLADDAEDILSQFQELETLQQIGHEFLMEQVQVSDDEKLVVEMGGLDSRLQLAHCTVEPEPFLPRGYQSVNLSSVGIACKGVKPWKIYIPAKIKIFTEVAVATNPIPRLERITAYDIQFIEKDKKPLKSGYFKSEQQLDGMVAKRFIAADTVITAGMIQPEQIVKRGETVLIVAGNEALQVEMQGVARDNGGIAEKIKVYNPSSKRVIEAIIIGPGKVRA